MKTKGLGKGLNALLSEEILSSNEEHGIKVVSINEVEPNFEQPRKKFSEEELNELCLSIQEHGILQPIIVRQKGDKYQIVAGERRYRAARLARFTELPIIIKDFSDQQTLEISLVENIQRQELNTMELAYAYSLLMERFDYTQEEVAEKLGKSRPSIANIIRLLNLSPYVQQKLRDEEISFGHGRAIAGIKEIAKQREIVDLVIKKKLSVRETEKQVQEVFLAPLRAPKPDKAESQNPFYREVQDNLQKALGTKVTISKGKKKGKIEIEYYNDDELERIICMIQNSN